jgi:cytochrome c
MKTLVTVLIGGSVLMCAPAFAGMDLVEEKQCLQCHDVSANGIGPSFKAVSAKWKGNKDAEKTLITTIRQGSAAAGGVHWQMKAEMPNDSERPLVSETEAKTIFKWIMSQ